MQAQMSNVYVFTVEAVEDGRQFTDYVQGTDAKDAAQAVATTLGYDASKYTYDRRKDEASVILTGTLILTCERG